MSKMTVEHVEECRAHAATGSATLVDQDFLIALCDLAKIALSPPQDVAGLVEELQEAASVATQTRAKRYRKAADALLAISARNRELEADILFTADALEPLQKQAEDEIGWIAAEVQEGGDFNKEDHDKWNGVIAAYQKLRALIPQEPGEKGK